MGTSPSLSIDLMHKHSKHNRGHIPFLKCSTNLHRLSIPQKRFGKEYSCHFGPSHKTCFPILMHALVVNISCVSQATILQDLMFRRKILLLGFAASIFQRYHTFVLEGGVASAMGPANPGLPSSMTTSTKHYSNASQRSMELSRSVSISNFLSLEKVLSDLTR